MNSFDAIKQQIAKELEERQNQNPVAVTSKPVPAVDVNGMPITTPHAMIGTVVSKPGTERIILDANIFQFMECEATGYGGKAKIRYCIVEKGSYATYGNQYINSSGERTHILTRDVYTLMLGVISGASKQVRTLTADLKQSEEMRDVYKTTIDALRKNGIID